MDKEKVAYALEMRDIYLELDRVCKEHHFGPTIASQFAYLLDMYLQYCVPTHCQSAVKMSLKMKSDYPSADVTDAEREESREIFTQEFFHFFNKIKTVNGAIS